MRKVAFLSGAISGLLLLLTGCTGNWYPFIYHPTLSQGNLIDDQIINTIKLGMNKGQIINSLGKPILQTPFSANTWWYVYTLREKGKIINQQKITLRFSGETLVSIEK